MTVPGDPDPNDPNDFRASLATLVEALEGRLRDGVEQLRRTSVVFRTGVLSYQLPGPAAAITRVSGTRADRAEVFTAGTDYALRGDRLDWLAAAAPPAAGSRLEVEFSVRDAPSGLTDFNAGSVAGTLVRAVAREIAVLYAQMQEAYRRAFIDDADGVALDNVVALLGVTRTAAQPATGQVTFQRRRRTTQTVVVAAGTRVADPSGREFSTTTEARIPIDAASATVPVVAVLPGPEHNVNADTITVMPTPPAGVEAVTNQDPTSGGQPAEPDDRLRDRAKHALERAGNSTLDAIRFAVLEVEGVQDVQVLDRQVDARIPLGEVRVRYSGGNAVKVAAAVQAARAAGVIARVEATVTVWVSGTFQIFPAAAPAPGAVTEFLAAVVEDMTGLGIGEPLPVRRLNARVFAVPGLADVAEAQLDSHRPTPSDPEVPILTDPLLVGVNELIRPVPGGLSGVVLAALDVTAHAATADGGYAITLRILDGQGGAASFRSLALDVAVTARATLRDNPTQPQVQVGSFTRNVGFTGPAATVAFTVADDLPDFRSADHVAEVEFTLVAAAYPRLVAAVHRVDVTA
jgi:uncharacterized phage protein gp47/JayE